MLAVDLGSRTTKAVLIERRGEVLALTRYALMDAPIYEKRFSPDMLSDHLRAVSEAVGGGTKFTALAVDADSTVVRQIEVPHMPVGEIRQLLKINYRNFMQQDMPGCVYDCHIFAPQLSANGKTAQPAKPAGMPKLKVLAVGAKQQLIEDYQTAIKNAGLVADCVVPGIVGPLNAFELSQPQVFENGAVALVDIGFKHSTICLLDRGELILSRVVHIGGDRLTAGLAETMNISYAEAEGIKIGLAPEAQAALDTQVVPLGRELRASIDFFEHQRDKVVSQIYVCGAAARSEMFLEMLRAEMIVECKTWNPTTFLQLALPGQQTAEIEQVGPQLSVAIGAAVAAL